MRAFSFDIPIFATASTQINTLYYDNNGIECTKTASD